MGAKYLYIYIYMPNRPLHSWGPYIWGLIHTITIIDFEDRGMQSYHVNEAIKILKNITHIIPCKKCASHYEAFINQELATGANIYESMTLFKLLVDYHNIVNRKMNKPALSHEEAYNIWVKVI